MNRDDIVRWAQEAAIMPPDWGATENQWRSLEAFAKLVAEHEREECAQIAFNAKTYMEAAHEIRERGAP